MNVAQILPFVQIGIAILLSAAVLLQQKGAGLSATFGGGGGFYRSKRGFEKGLLVGTIVLAILFMSTGALNVFLSIRTGAPAFPSTPPQGITIPETSISDIEFEPVPAQPGE